MSELAALEQYAQEQNNLSRPLCEQLVEEYLRHIPAPLTNRAQWVMWRYACKFWNSMGETSTIIWVARTFPRRQPSA